MTDVSDHRPKDTIMALGWRAARFARAVLTRRAIGILAIFAGTALWLGAALWLGPTRAAIGVVIGGASVAAGLVLILCSI
jgi:hypothetical protein